MPSDDEFHSAGEGEEPVTASKAEGVSDGRKFHRFAKGGDVLVFSVEDDEVNQMVIKNFMDTFGYEVEPVLCGEEALEVLEELPEFPDVILLDYTLPDMTGDDVYNQIVEKYDGNNNIPFILTGADLNRFNVRVKPGKPPLLEVEKPMTRQRLEAALNQALK